MYVIYEKDSGLVFDFKADPTMYMSNQKYSFTKVSTYNMYDVYKQMGLNKLAYFNANEMKFWYKDKPISAFQKETEALSLIREYSIYNSFPLNERIDAELLSRLVADLDICADIVAAKGDIELDVPLIDYI